MISIKNHTTTRANVGADTQTLFDERATLRACLTGELGSHGNDGNVMHGSIGVHPGQELCPPCIMNAFRQVMVTYHVADLQVFIGNQIVRCDKRACRFAGKVFTLPLDFQIPFGEALAGFLAVLAPLLLPGKMSMQTLQSLLCLAVVTWVFYRIAMGVGIEGGPSNVYTYHASSRDMFDLALCLDTELSIVPIGSTHKTHPLDLLDGEGFKVLVGIAYQTEPTNATTIGEANVLAVVFQLPPRGFVFHAAVVMLKTRIAFLAWLVVLAVFKEAANSKPGPVSTGLTGLGIETSGKGEVFGEDGTVALQVILVDATLIHPQAQALISDELNSTDGFINGAILPFRAIYLVLENQHVLDLSFSFVILYSLISLYVKRRKNQCANNALICISPNGKRSS
jgi:hypothetical protein